MSVAVIKALCRRIEQRVGNGRLVALALNITPGVWSTYCNEDHPDTTIPFHRLLTIANGEELAAFAELLAGDDPAVAGDPLTETLEASEAALDLQRLVRERQADGTLCETDRRAIRKRALALRAAVDDVIRAVDE